jgi:hypothetical protein
MFYKIFGFLFFLFCSTFVFSQGGEIRLYDSTKCIFTDYIENFSDSIAVSLISSTKNSKFQIAANLQNSSESKIVKYAPHNNSSLGVGFDYKWLGFSLSLSLPQSKASNEHFGRTDQLDFQSNIYLRKFIFDLNFTTYKGYYIDNPNDFDTPWNDSLPYPQRADIRTASVGAGFSYITNSDKFSYKAAFTTTERQKKSAGSWILGGFFSIYDLRADSNILYYAKNYSFNDSAKIKSASVSNIGISAGYAFTFAIKRYYISLSFVPGLAYQSSFFRIENNNIGINKSGINIRTQARFAFGFSGDFYFWGVAFVSDSYQLKNSTTSQLKYSFGIAKFFFGWRFGYSRFKEGIS